MPLKTNGSELNKRMCNYCETGTGCSPVQHHNTDEYKPSDADTEKIKKLNQKCCQSWYVLYLLAFCRSVVSDTCWVHGFLQRRCAARYVHLTLNWVNFDRSLPPSLSLLSLTHAGSKRRITWLFSFFFFFFCNPAILKNLGWRQSACEKQSCSSATLNLSYLQSGCF